MLRSVEQPLTTDMANTHGTLTVLFDCGFEELEALRWLFTADESLPGTPIDAIVKHRCTEVNRRAQALAF